jgi:type I restriction enzyme S subunit
MLAENKINPVLRFKDSDGCDYLDWQEDILIDLCKEKFANGVFNDPKKVGTGYKLINVKDMYIGNSIEIEMLTLLNISSNEFSKNKVLKGDVFFTRSSLVKEGIAYSNVFLSDSDDVTYDGHLIRMRVDEKKINSTLLNYLLRTNLIRKQLISRGKTATMTTIGQQDVASIQVFYPLLAEQQKIANFLSSVDTKIEQLSKKQNLLTQYKKGMMQKLFSQTIRFKADDGSDYPDWEEKRLGDIAKFYDSNRIPLSQEERNKKQGSYPYYGASGIIDYVDDYLFDGEYILLGEDGANIVMRNSPLAYLATGKFWVNNHAHVIQSNESNAFLCEALERINYVQYNTGTAQPKLNAAICKKIILAIPLEKEQQKIASFLSSVDTKIEQLSKKQNLLTQYKKGMMQKLFSQTIRFKADDGNDYPDWENRSFAKNICEYKKKSLVNREYEVFTSSNKGLVLQKDYFENNRLVGRSNIGFNIVPQGYITYRSRSDNRKFTFNLNTLKLTGIISTYYPVFTINNGSNNFFIELVNFNKYHVGKYSVGTSQTVLSLSELKKIKFGVPSNDEQQKIANFLSSIDKKIEQINNQITQTKQYKKALLQQMFV